MSSASEAPPRTGDVQTEAFVAPHEAFIENRLRQTRRQVKGVDLAGGLITLAIGTLVCLLAAALVDHWVVSGGLGFWGRLLILAGLLLAAGFYCVRFILPSLVHRINPVYAAQTIEQGRPTLKNSLINFLLLRSHRREVSPVIYRALQDRAAADLTQVPPEVAVDRSHVIRLGYLLIGTLTVFCLYLAISPKNPLVSAARIVWPWAQIKAPTRVTIDNIEPGDAVVYHGDFVSVSAEVAGVDEGESVLLYYSTADGQSIDQKIAMTVPEDGYRYRCELPPGRLGLQQDVEYHLAAGDCKTRRFAVKVQTAPAIVVDAIDYDYPAYTGITDRTVDRQGDLRAIEGTVVTIRATANQPIQRAEIDLDCDGLNRRDMLVAEQTATGRITLATSRTDPNLSEHESYQLRFTDRAGRLNPRPIRYRIEVIRDLPPEIQLLEPQQEDVQLGEDGRLQIRVRAEDPDFALQRVLLRAECAGRPLAVAPLLDQTHPGDFTGTYVFEPARATFAERPADRPQVGLKAGDRVVYWVEAEDNKQPLPGLAKTEPRWITIIGPQSPLEPPPQADPNRVDPAQQDPQQTQQGPANQPPEQTPGEPQSAGQEPGKEPTDQPPQGQPPQDDSQRSEQGPQASPAPQPSETPGEASEPGTGDGQSKTGTVGEDGSENAQPQTEQPSEPIDGETNPGDAFEQILQHRQQQQQGDQQQANQQQANQQQANQQQGDQQQANQQQGDQQQANQQQG
ncbi:MAG: hypothetical protein JXB62_12510, partial [Pirellulales bacterium]|nr:hypothetical protein [Pirellulales bacterium]